MNLIKDFYSGRINRINYFLASLLVTIVLGGLLVLSTLLLNESDLTLGTIIIILGIVYFLISVSLKLRRVHDLNYNGWILIVFIPILFIPGIGQILALYLLFAPGNKMDNGYGKEVKNVRFVDSFLNK